MWASWDDVFTTFFPSFFFLMFCGDGGSSRELGSWLRTGVRCSPDLDGHLLLPALLKSVSLS